VTFGEHTRSGTRPSPAFAKFEDKHSLFVHFSGGVLREDESSLMGEFGAMIERLSAIRRRQA